MPLTEKNFTGVAEKALAGDRAGAVDAAVTVLATAATGSPLAGVVAGKGARALVSAAVGGATRRLQDADKEYDNEQARNREFQFLVYEALKPAFEAVWNRDEERLAELIRGQAGLREDHGQILGKLQDIEHKVVEMATELEAARQLAYYAAWKETQKMECVRETSMSKYLCAETGKKIAVTAMQIMGNYASTMTCDVQRYFRDVVILSIGGGTTQIQKNIIAKTLGL